MAMKTLNKKFRNLTHKGIFFHQYLSEAGTFPKIVKKTGYFSSPNDVGGEVGELWAFIRAWTFIRIFMVKKVKEPTGL